MQQGLRFNRRSFRFWIFLMTCMMSLSIGGSITAKAWLPGFLRHQSQKDDWFTKKQAKAMALKLVRDLLQQPFFKKEELSQRVQFALLTLDVQKRDMTEREFTDIVLNATDNYPGIIVVNQEPTLSVQNLDQKLFSYDNEWASRKRGVMLGADYVLTGSIGESVTTDERGRAYKVYNGTLTVKEIHKGSVVAVAHTSQNKKKLKRKR